MLVLTRKTNQAIVVGNGPDACEIIVVEIRGDKVRLGLAAAKHVRIDRREIRNRKDAGEVLSCPR